MAQYEQSDRRCCLKLSSLYRTSEIQLQGTHDSTQATRMSMAGKMLPPTRGQDDGPATSTASPEGHESDTEAESETDARDGQSAKRHPIWSRCDATCDT